MPNVSEEKLGEFMEIYREEFKETLTHAEAREMTRNLLELYQLVYQPLPGEHESSVSKRKAGVVSHRSVDTIQRRARKPREDMILQCDCEPGRHTVSS